MSANFDVDVENRGALTFQDIYSVVSEFLAFLVDIWRC